jgi:queuine tRNA-ribosyltransferase
MPAFSFEILVTDPRTLARAGIIHTLHGDVPTPAFVPVGTQATVKAVTPRDLQDLGASVILANTYHLALRPGAKLIAQVGGLHPFMAWDGPIITDSGGFQVFSLADQRRLDDDGVVFRSHIDGSEHRFTPESIVGIQEQLGADVITPLDVCTPGDSSFEENVAAIELTHRWAERSLAAKTREDQALFGIVQGGTFANLRARSAEFIRSLPFPGYAIGGLSVGEPKDVMLAMLDVQVPLLPTDKPRHLLGVGAPEDVLAGVARGIDTFDCVLPTREARHARVLTRQGRLNLRNAQFAGDPAPIEADCACYTCQHFSRAYLRHLFKAGEVLGLILATVHNLHFMLQLMHEIRQAILNGCFAALTTP